MTILRKNIFWLLSIFGYGCVVKPPVATTHERSPLLLIAIDGLRFDHPDSCHTPHLDAFTRQGLISEALLPVFPTKTFPNHYSIVTGLYPDRHGIVANKMYDPVLESWFEIGPNSRATRDPAWFEGEAIWTTAKRQGLKTATLFWPGSDAAPEEYHPDLHKYYDGKMSFQARVDTIISWLSLKPPMRPDFVCTYFESPDKEGHKFGPFALQTKKAVESIDQYIGTLVTQLDAIGMSDSVNVLIVSDHGMIALDHKKTIFLDDYLDLTKISTIDLSPKVDFLCTRDSAVIIYKTLLSAHPHLTPYLKEHTPDRFHYQNHSRIPNVWALADPGWSISTRRLFPLRSRIGAGGTHGYDNNNHDMWAYFSARGPAFRQGQEMPSVENIHLYSLMCHLLQIQPAINDGTIRAFLPYLVESPN